MKKIKLTLAILALNVVVGNAQNILEHSIEWSAGNSENLKNGDQFQFNCRFETIGREKIDWVQKKGSVRFSFRITGTEGAWENISTNGQMKYFIEYDGKAGYMIIKKDAEGTTIAYELDKNSSSGSAYVFQVSSYAVKD